MKRNEAKRWILALMASGGIAAYAPAGAEIVYSSDMLAQSGVNTTEPSMHMQLCARIGVDGSCLDGRTTAKQRLLAPPSSPKENPSEPPDLGAPPPVITLPPPVIDELPPVGESAPLLPIAARPTSIAVPEPGSLSLAALGAVFLASALHRRRRRSAGR